MFLTRKGRLKNTYLMSRASFFLYLHLTKSVNFVLSSVGTALKLNIWHTRGRSGQHILYFGGGHHPHEGCQRRQEGWKETGSSGEWRKKAIRAVDILFMLEILKLFYWEPVDSSTN